MHTNLLYFVWLMITYVCLYTRDAYIIIYYIFPSYI